jgi:hypothetical protein
MQSGSSSARGVMNQRNASVVPPAPDRTRCLRDVPDHALAELEETAPLRAVQRLPGPPAQLQTTDRQIQRSENETPPPFA